ncbi:hypothetical protein TNCV_5064081 [Trichonephila clavipes]|nr:hypothetical protein TNCV_5064081 [Trichonephila clavipes]
MTHGCPSARHLLLVPPLFIHLAKKEPAEYEQPTSHAVSEILVPSLWAIKKFALFLIRLDQPLSPSLAKNDSSHSVNTIELQSDVLPILFGNSVCEEQKDDTDLSVSSIQKSASELNSAVFKAWCEVKDNAKDIKTTSLKEIETSDARATSDDAYSVWKKSKVEAFRKARKAKQSAISKNAREDTEENKTEEIEMEGHNERRTESQHPPPLIHKTQTCCQVFLVGSCYHITDLESESVAIHMDCAPTSRTAHPAQQPLMRLPLTLGVLVLLAAA